MVFVSYGELCYLVDFIDFVWVIDDGGFVIEKVDWEVYVLCGDG